MRKLNFILINVILISNVCFAQITPPGLGKANTAQWFALGLEQQLSALKNVTSTSYFGIGSKSDPDNYNPIEKSSLYVINEELSHGFKKHWKLSAAASYRWQNNFETEKPFDLNEAEARQELRFYSKASYTLQLNKVSLSFAFRPEMRCFFDRNFGSYQNPFQIRTRKNIKFLYHLNRKKSQAITASAEALFASNKTEAWGKFQYQESRFCLYYSFAVLKQKLALNLGYMNALAQSDVHYFAFDIIVKNPF